MNVQNLYPDPPHLTLSVWAPGSEAPTFAGACRAVAAAGGSPTGVVVTAPAATRFEWLYEIDQAPEDIGDRFEPVIHGDGTGSAAFRAGFLRDDQLIVVERAPGPRDEIHPVRATMAAEPLGIPTDLWLAEDRAAAASFIPWLRSLFENLVLETSALYGALDIEAEMPTPSQLLDGEEISSDLFISRALAERDPRLLPDLRIIHPRADEAEWPAGNWLVNWSPLRRDGLEGEPFSHERNEAAARRLGRSVARYLAADHPG